MQESSWSDWARFARRGERLPPEQRSLDCSAFIEATSELDALGKLHARQLRESPDGATVPQQSEGELMQVPPPLPAAAVHRQP
jgi:hypothetical protein